jgi:hypothetical protein
MPVFEEACNANWTDSFVHFFFLSFHFENDTWMQLLFKLSERTQSTSREKERDWDKTVDLLTRCSHWTRINLDFGFFTAFSRSKTNAFTRSRIKQNPWSVKTQVTSHQSVTRKTRWKMVRPFDTSDSLNPSQCQLDRQDMKGFKHKQWKTHVRFYHLLYDSVSHFHFHHLCLQK